MGRCSPATPPKEALKVVGPEAAGSLLLTHAIACDYSDIGYTNLRMRQHRSIWIKARVSVRLFGTWALKHRSRSGRDWSPVLHFLPMSEDKTYYRRHLPHYHPEAATFHTVFRLAGSLPLSIIGELRQEKERLERQLKTIKNVNDLKQRQNDILWKYFERFDSLLDGSLTGPTWLREPNIAAIVRESMHHLDGKEYDLFAYCIMPNHVHMVFSIEARVPRPDHKTDGTRVPSYIVSDILGSIKKFTGRKANPILGREGAFWQDESYDHVIRDATELRRTIHYVLNNPVNAGLAQSWEQWPWNYAQPGML